MLSCDDLTVAQGAFSLAANIDLPKGAVTAVMGASGAGKSTLLAAIAGFAVPASGTVSYDGQDITTLAPGKRPVSVLFQDNNLFPHLSIAENVGLGLRRNRALKPSEKEAVTGVLTCVGIEADFEERKPAQLSGGQQSRVALARLLLSELPVALLDEPFSALGPALKDEMLDLMRATLLRSRDATVLMVTHDPADAKRSADYVVWVDNGVASSPRLTGEIFGNPPAGLRQYLGEMG